MTKLPTTTIALLALASLARAGDDPVIKLTINAIDLPRNLIKTVSVIQTDPKGGPLELRYCVWTPGNHSPSGPIENIAKLTINDCNGNTLDWNRDSTKPDRINVIVPEGCSNIDVRLSYIASQPNANSRTSDSYGRAGSGAINFNTLLLYPADRPVSEIDVQPIMLIPEGWKAASALPLKTNKAGKNATGVIFLAKPPLPELIDSPVLVGESLTTTYLQPPPPGLRAEHTINIVANEAEHAKLPEFLRPCFEAMTREAAAVFGPFPRNTYRFLLHLGDGYSGGLEHAESTFIGLPERVLIDAKADNPEGPGAGLGAMTHEYIHAWCGKLRAPEGLITGDFSTPAQTELLWVYEGLTTYYTMVLSARSGLSSPAAFMNQIADLAAAYQQRTGHLWRSSEDSARATRLLRQSSNCWLELRGGRDYYGDGALFWLEADGIIRTGTNGAKSLDDFCKAFFAVPAKPVGAVATYNRADIIATLKGVYDGQDWDGLIRERLERPAKNLDPAPILFPLGYRFELANEPNAIQNRHETRDADGGVNLRTSLGLACDKGGVITAIIPGSPADTAGLAFSSKIIGVNNWTFTPERLRDAVKNSPTTEKVDLLLTVNDRIVAKTIEYKNGPKWPSLVLLEGAPDHLKAIAAPRAISQ